MSLHMDFFVGRHPLVSFLKNHEVTTKLLTVGSIRQICQGNRPDALNIQILDTKTLIQDEIYRLMVTDGRDVLQYATVKCTAASLPSKFSIIKISDRDSPNEGTYHQVKAIGIKGFAFVIYHFTVVKEGCEIGYKLQVSDEEMRKSI